MSFPTDIEIARKSPPRPIGKIASDLSIHPDDLIPFGYNRAKVNYRAIERSERPEGQLILVSAITPTPAGEGKTTISIGLAQGLAKIGKRVALALREPSMGPLFGMKGGATGGGYSQVIPMDEINLMFNGDFPAISAAHNLLAAALDNSIHYRQLPDLDPRRIIFPRVVDMNDRSLRRLVIGLGGKTMGVPRETHYDITAASEVMAIMALAQNHDDLRQRLSRILVGLTYDGKPITAESLKVSGAMTTILKEAIHPNLVQTLEGVPAFIHCGPFANIAHGSNSVLATRMALFHADYAVTEAGFGFDLGAEKFFDITCRAGGYAPELCVLVATVRALKMHGGVKKKKLKDTDPAAVERGLPNMEKHIENIAKFQVPVVVAVNRFEGDDPEELNVVLERCKELGVPAAIADIHARGGEGGVELAEAVVDAMCEGCQVPLKPLYDYDWSPEKKIDAIAKEIYGAEHVDYTIDGKRDLKTVYKLGYDKLAVCMAKTPKSLSDNPALLGRPKDFIITVRGIEISAGAGFIVPLTGDILRMPGLPKKPAYLGIDLLDDGTVVGLS
ncbi:MAG: formate--tetrahydrofolate ligase [Deltaproteobacteria bacterium]|nr:formate--tetrahydrofolate ligase [Deltaproteobacteria bacterium]